MDKDQLSQALDKIHSAASHSDTLTTFNEFASPPSFSANTESKGIAGDIMHNGLSGLYSRFRGAVGAGIEKSGLSSHKGNQENLDAMSTKSQGTPISASRGSTAPPREDSGITASPAQLSTSSSRLQSPTMSSFAAQSSESQSQILKSSKTSLGSTAATTPATSKSTTSSRPSMTPMIKATTSSAIIPTVASVNVSAFKEGDSGRMSTDLQRSENGLETLPNGAREATFGFVDTRESKRGPTASSTVDDSEGSDDPNGGEISLGIQDRQYLGGDGSLELSKGPFGEARRLRPFYRL